MKFYLILIIIAIFFEQQTNCSACVCKELLKLGENLGCSVQEFIDVSSVQILMSSEDCLLKSHSLSEFEQWVKSANKAIDGVIYGQKKYESIRLAMMSTPDLVRVDNLYQSGHKFLKGLRDVSDKNLILRVIREFKRCDCNREDADVIKQLNENRKLFKKFEDIFESIERVREKVKAEEVKLALVQARLLAIKKAVDEWGSNEELLQSLFDL